MEPPPHGGIDPSRTREWVQRLEQHLPSSAGVVVEDKRYSVTLHYRQAPNKARAVRAIDEALRHLPEIRAIAGSQAVSLLPLGARHKGVALQEARRLFACDTAVYVGDDETDEDAFMSGEGDRLLSIRVGAAPTSGARYRLRNQRAVDDLLRTLIALRTAPRTPRQQQ
jgi:trehalose 6-phosphate phosphatase